MVDTTEVVAHIIRLIKKQKYVIIEDIPQSLSLRPEVYSKKGKNKILFYIRKSNSIPEALVQRISLSKTGGNIDCRVVFCKKPNKTMLFLLSLYGVNAHYFIKNKLSNLLIVSPKKAIKKELKNKKIPTIHIFISSHQIIDERKIVKQLIEDLARGNRWPLFPICVEDNYDSNIKQTRKVIITEMDKSEWFIGILADEFRKDVNFEIRRAFSDKCPIKEKNIIIFLKLTKVSKKVWEKLINFIEKRQTVRYHEYSDIRDLSAKVLGKLQYKIKEEHKKRKIDF